MSVTLQKAPNVLFLMADQLRFDTIAALGNAHIYTPNIDRLVARGVACTNAYSPTPVCVAARYTIRTGSSPALTRWFANASVDPVPGQANTVPGRTGPYLAETMRTLGYRTFGIGKFHTMPWDEPIGYDVHLHSEELYTTPDQKRRDAFAAFIAQKHPAYNYIETLMGERTEMYYMPQISPQPAEATVERWAADRAIKQIRTIKDQPYFGFVSFIGPHPPLAPPVPFNRLYDPDRMLNPVKGDLESDHTDAFLPWMNYAVFADDISDSHARTLKARYYGEITYIDDCIGRILDAVEAREDAENTLICFFSDHGDLLGDHSAWQKESYFEASCRVPFLLSWPKQIAAKSQSDALVSLTDLFGIATTAAGKPELREGTDILGMLQGTAPARDSLVGYYGAPGSRNFKIMVRREHWKYIFFANGGREQLFNLQADPQELQNRTPQHQDIAASLRAHAGNVCQRPELSDALDKDQLRSLPFEPLPLSRIYQFDRSQGVTGFPANPADVLRQWKSQPHHGLH